jgi:hypothetical protein
MSIFNQHPSAETVGTSCRSLRLPGLTLLLLTILIAPPGCSKEEIKQKLEEAKAKTKSLTESAVQAVEEQLPESGHVALDMDSPGQQTPVELKQADLELISIGDARPNVLQIVTYDPSASTRTYPSLMLQGTTTASSASALAGTTVACDMYFQATPSAPIAKTAIGHSVSVSFGSLNVDDNALPATLSAIGLVGSDDKPVQIRGGQILAVIRGEGN